MTARRSRSALSGGLVLAALIAAACAHGPPPREPHPLESPPPSADLVGKLSFRDAKAEDTLIDLAPELGVGYVELSRRTPASTRGCRRTARASSCPRRGSCPAASARGSS